LNVVSDLTILKNLFWKWPSYHQIYVEMVNHPLKTFRSDRGNDPRKTLVSSALSLKKD